MPVPPYLYPLNVLAPRVLVHLVPISSSLRALGTIAALIPTPSPNLLLLQPFPISDMATFIHLAASSKNLSRWTPILSHGHLIQQGILLAKSSSHMQNPPTFLITCPAMVLV